jgi:hypothetical protein
MCAPSSNFECWPIAGRVRHRHIDRDHLEALSRQVTPKRLERQPSGVTRRNRIAAATPG